MNPIKSADEAQRGLSIRPEHVTESDIVRSPGPVNTVRFANAEDGTAETAQKLRELDDKNSESGVDLKESLEKLNSEMRQKRISLSFSVDEGTDSVVVQVVDSTSGKVIRQIPPDELLALRKRFEDLAGMLVDQRV